MAAACRTFRIHRSTYYRWKARIERSGLEMLRPRERRAPCMPNQSSPVIEARILAFAIAHPGLVCKVHGTHNEALAPVTSLAAVTDQRICPLTAQRF